MNDEVTKFEETILFFADAYRLHGPGSKFSNPSDARPQTLIDQISIEKLNGSGTTTATTPSSLDSGNIHTQELTHYGKTIQDNDFLRQSDIHDVAKNKNLEAWQLEAASVDRSILMLPGVKKFIDSIPAGRYAVATSATKTLGNFTNFMFSLYLIILSFFVKAYGSLNRVGIIPPTVTITADDKRLKAGKPAPDTFLLAADCLGYDPKKCVVFEDSPAGICSGVASGATVIAVCTSHERSKIKNCGAHYIISCEVEGDLLKFSLVV